jgi:HSP20 family molecular chaperone IbpA
MNEEEELLQQPLSHKQIMSRKNMRNCCMRRSQHCQGEFNPQCFLQNQRHFLSQFEDEDTSASGSSSSSSSSTSTDTDTDTDTTTSSSSTTTTTSSESEEEYYPRKMSASRRAMKRNLFQQHQQQRLVTASGALSGSGTPRKWFTVVNIPGFLPKDVTAKLNPKCRILVIKAKQNAKTIPWKQQQCPRMMGSQVLEVIVLPENIHLQQIKVQMTQNGQLIVAAPFVLPNEQQRGQQTRYASTWIPIHVTLKDSSVDVLGKQLGGLGLSKRCQQSQYGLHPMQQYTAAYSTPGKQYRPIQDFQHECFTQPQQQGLQQETSISKLFCPEYIRDTATGKVVMIYKVNTLGFLPKEVTVSVIQDKGFLVVEAIKKSLGSLKDVSKQQLLEQGVPVKYLCREFVLPEFLDIKNIGYYVMKNGLLLIKLPIVKSQLNKLQELGNINVEEKQLKNINWERAMTV